MVTQLILIHLININTVINVSLATFQIIVRSGSVCKSKILTYQFKFVTVVTHFSQYNCNDNDFEMHIPISFSSNLIY